MDRLRGKFLRVVLLVLGLATLSLSVVVLNLIRVNVRLHQLSMSHVAARDSSYDERELIHLRREALTRAILYERLIERDMLLDGMVIHRGPKGEPLGLCDSLLFSNLRYYALRKLGLSSEADAAWQAILNSRVGGQWLRHPKCAKSLSRDMVMGVLVGLSADPEEGDLVFERMLAQIDSQMGFVGDGPFYVSWLSPGIAGLLRAEAERRNIPFEKWPWIMKQSFSSIEYDTIFLGEGYVSHLAALGLDLELNAVATDRGFNPRSILGQVERLARDWGGGSSRIDTQRLQWIATHLRTINHSNLYFEWLEQRAFGVLSPARERELLERLLSMSQFPAVRLPADCDRDADYLWQRRDADAVLTTSSCGYQWNGVDFIWMAAMLGAGAAHPDDSDAKNHSHDRLSH